MPLLSSHAFRAACLLATLVVAIVIVFQSAQARGTPGVLDLTTNEAYIGHFTVYALLAFSAMMAVGRRTLLALVAVLALAAGLGVAMELYQAQMPTRAASTGDVLADVSGAVFGVATYVVLASRLTLIDWQQASKP